MTTIRLYNGRDNDAMIRRLKDAINGDVQVSTLEVRGTVLDEHVIEAIVVLLLKRDIETVQLDDCGAYLNKPAISMARALGNVRNVRLSEPTFLSQYFLDSLLMSATKLKHLRIQDHLDTRQIEALSKGLKANTSVEILDLSRSRFDSFTILANGLKENACLKELKLRSLAGLSDDHVGEILTALKNHPTLESLDLSFNHCRNVGNLAEFLVDERKSIRELCLGYQNLWQAPKFDVRGLAQALRTNTTLKTLSLSRNKLTDADARLLAEGLHDNSTLESLDVRENKLSDDGIVALANAAEESGTGLRRLSVIKNPFRMKGALALLSAVRENLNLVHLEIAENESLSEEIRYFAALNKGGRKLLREAPTLSLWPLAFERVNNMDWDGESSDAFDLSHDNSYQADVLFYLLKGPALFEGLL
jgi:Ran GTPase-activating protein (RanGAP) involved in mRNA processing and transport